MSGTDPSRRRGGEPLRPKRVIKRVNSVHQNKLRPGIEAEIDFSRLRVLKTEPKCKICKHPDRAEFDRMIYRQRLGRKRLDDSGKIIDVQYVLDFMASRGMGNAHVGNIRAHWGKHTDVPTVEQIEHTEKLVEGLMAKLTPEEIENMPRGQMLDLMMRQGVSEAAARLRVTGKSGITVEHVLKMAELQIREKGSEAQNEFLKALGGGIVAAIGPGRGQGGPTDEKGRYTKQIAESEVVDVLAAEVEEVAA